MKYLKLFESEENMVDNILDVFQNMQDFELEFTCDKMYEFSVKLDQSFNLQGFTYKKSNDTFYGYFMEGKDYAVEWWFVGRTVYSEKYGIHDYYDNYELVKILGKYKLSNIVGKSFYKIEVTGKFGYIKDNFSEISSEIRNSVLRLENMYDLKLHNNKSIFYQNGLVVNFPTGQEFFPVNWISNPAKISRGYNLPREYDGLNIPSNRLCHLGIYLK